MQGAEDEMKQDGTMKSSVMCFSGVFTIRTATDTAT